MDSIIDDLSVGLNEAVAHVVKEAVTAAVQQAVEAVLQAVLSNPEVLRGLAALGSHPATAPVEAAKPSLASRLVAGAMSACASTRRRAAALVAGLRRPLAAANRLKVQLLTAAGVGVAAGAVAYLAGPLVAAAAGWLGGFVTTLGVHAWLALRRGLLPVVAGAG